MINKNNSEKLEILLRELIQLFESSLGNNPFIELEKSLKIVLQKNYNQYPSIIKKLKGIIMVIYGSQIKNEEEIIKKLDGIYKILKENE
jgi:hypothetical protein